MLRWITKSGGDCHIICDRPRGACELDEFFNKDHISNPISERHKLWWPPHRQAILTRHVVLRARYPSTENVKEIIETA
jgi:hypothetical protein